MYLEYLVLTPGDIALDVIVCNSTFQVMLKDIAGASSDFEQALCMCPYYAHIYFNRGNLYASLQMYELAEKDFTTGMASC